MSPSLVHAHDSRIHFKLDEIAENLVQLAIEIHEAGVDVADARLKVQAVFDRRQEIARDVAILREMLGVR